MTLCSSASRFTCILRRSVGGRRVLLCSDDATSRSNARRLTSDSNCQTRELAARKTLGCLARRKSRILSRAVLGRKSDALPS